MATVATATYNRMRRDTITLAVGETSQWLMVATDGVSISVIPSGAAITVQYSQDDPAVVQGDIANGTSNSHPIAWSLGAVTTPSNQVFTRITAVRFMCAAGASGTAFIAE